MSERSRPLRLLRGTWGLLAPLVLVVGLAALALFLLNQVPPLLEKVTYAEYASIGEAERDLRVRILLPAFFPETISFPPAKVAAESEPVLDVRLDFRSRQGEETVLSIREVFTQAALLPIEIPEPPRVTERVAVELDGREGVLLQGTDAAGRSLNQLRWRLPDRHLVFTTTHSAEELLRMGRSVRP